MKAQPETAKKSQSKRKARPEAGAALTEDPKKASEPNLTAKESCADPAKTSDAPAGHPETENHQACDPQSRRQDAAEQAGTAEDNQETRPEGKEPVPEAMETLGAEDAGAQAASGQSRPDAKEQEERVDPESLDPELRTLFDAFNAVDEVPVRPAGLPPHSAQKGDPASSSKMQSPRGGGSAPSQETDDPPQDLCFEPLASRLRPKSIDEYLGQEHLTAPGRPLRQALEHKQCYSMILWGPPGSGKTTLALIMARSIGAVLEQISAVTSGVKDIRAAIDKAKQRRLMGIRTLLFVDEVHRFNKAQQDAFLPHIEDGTITFIGATTENPSFELNQALLSRVRVFALKKLEEADLERLLDFALSTDLYLKKLNLRFDPKARQALLQLSGGDARRLLNTLEMVSDLAAPQDDGSALITYAMVGAAAGQRLLNYDKGGDQYYDLISAFHKSVRGSSPDAALYYFGRIVEAGGDPLYVARRLLAIATEDVGLADPQAMQIALNAWDIYERVGDAEGLRAIAEAAVYLAIAPKSNALYTAMHEAFEDAKRNGTLEVPLYLRNAPTKLMEELGYHKGYRYAHDYPGAYAAGESFLPYKLRHQNYYRPSDRGREQRFKEKLEYLRKLDAQSTDKRYED